MITMTYNEALKIQAAQMAWYRQSIGRSGCKAIISRTIGCPFNPDKPMPIITINNYVPRGGCFERYIYRYGNDPTREAWHNAIRNNKIYH